MHYQMVLPGEVEVSNKNIRKIFKEKEVFVLGYGSLLYSSGWLDRGMAIVPGKNDLTECLVVGYERGTFGLYTTPRWNNKYSNGLHFYGVVPEKSASLNGVLVKIHSYADWCSLMCTECIAGIANNYNYRCVDVTDRIRGIKLKKDQVVHMVVNEPQNKDNWHYYTPAPRYYDRVATGVKRERSAKFKAKFYATGGLTLKQAQTLYKSSKMKGWW